MRFGAEGFSVFLVRIIELEVFGVADPIIIGAGWTTEPPVDRPHLGLVIRVVLGRDLHPVRRRIAAAAVVTVSAVLHWLCPPLSFSRRGLRRAVAVDSGPPPQPIDFLPTLV